ncbi:uncharacterized protein LOC108193536 isoform X1 [Daucus carota subsp. sativus]|nr:PREDICTED: uncharacterized protein LOC108193536 isoform X1 [Daucus carota subsp. sativus]
MGLSRLLHPPISTRSFGVARQTRRQLSSSSSLGNKSQIAKARKSEAVETYVRKYVETHPGSLPKLSHVQKEIGGSWYTLKELFENAKEKIFGDSKVQRESVNDVTLTSATDATASTNITTQDKGSEKSEQNEATKTLANAFCHKSNILPNAMPGTSGENLPDMMGDTALDAKRICTDVESTGPCKPRNLIQSSAAMNSEDNSVSQAISYVKPELCSKIQINATALEGECDSPYTRTPEAASKIEVDRVAGEGFLYKPNLFQPRKKHVQLKEFHNAFDEPEKLSSLIFEATRPWQGKVEDEKASTGCKNQVENKMFTGYDKKIVDPPSVEADKKHLESEDKPSTELVSPNAETTTATLQKDVPTTYHSIRKENQLQKEQKVSKISGDEVSKASGMPGSGRGAQKFTRLSALFSKVDDQKAGQVADKYNIWETNGYLENSDNNNIVNVPKPSDSNDLIACIKGYSLGQQVTSGPGNAVSYRTDQNHHIDHVRVLSQVNMQNLDGLKTSSSHIFNEKIEEPSVEAPMKKAYINGKANNREKGNTESVSHNAITPSMRMGHPDNAQDPTCRGSLDQYKVIVKFVHKDVEEQELRNFLKRFDNNLKIELSGAGKRFFKTATVYFKTWTGMQNALKATDLLLRNWTITLEEASSLKSQSKSITIPRLIGDPDAPAALVKNPTRTVAIKQLTHEICPRHIEEALAFCESNISGFYLGTSDSVAYVEFETEDGKDKALAKHSIDVIGKRLFIYRVDTPRTTVVRIKTMLPAVVPRHIPIFKSLGKVKACYQRSANILDVHFSITEWTNMLKILNKLNGLQVDGVRLIAEPAPIAPSDILLQIYSQPEERERMKSNMHRLLQKLEENAVHKTKVTDIFSKFYGER